MNTFQSALFRSRLTLPFASSISPAAFSGPVAVPSCLREPTLTFSKNELYFAMDATHSTVRTFS